MEEDTKEYGQPLWHGRIQGSSATVLRNLNSSIGFDSRLYKEDIFGSKAHARMLQKIGVFNESELSDVLKALDQIEIEIESGSIEVLSSDEDVHTLVERRLTEITPAGARLHTGEAGTIKSQQTFVYGLEEL